MKVAFSIEETDKLNRNNKKFKQRDGGGERVGGDEIEPQQQEFLV